MSGSQGLDRPWLRHYPAGVPATIDPLANGTLADILRDSGRRFGAAPAFESFGKAISYADLILKAEQITRWLQARGFQRGDRVALMMPNILAYPVTMVGVLLGGFTIVNVNPLYTARELTHQLNDSGARALFVLENFAHVVEEALPQLRLDAVIVTNVGDLMGWKGHIVNFVARKIKKVVKPFSLPGALSLKAVMEEGASRPLLPVDVSPDDVAFLQYTGGTTGIAKGAMLLHRNITANVAQCDAWITPFLSKSEGVGSANGGPGASQHVMIAALPLYHIFALTACCIYMLRLGALVRLIANPRDIPGFVKTLAGARFTMICGVNTLFNALLNNRNIRSVDFSHLQMAVAGGMAMQGPVANRWKEVTGKAIIEGYGLTETSPIVSVNPLSLEAFSGTIGFPVSSTDIVIRKEDGTDAAIGEPGELCVRGPQVMAGYWRRPDETAKAMTTDGYFRTGDIAIMLPDGQFKIVDRLKDMVIVSGFNVYPNEVEEVISGHPGVLEVAVIGLPDAHSGEAVAAYVVRKDGSLTVETLREHCRLSLTGYKVPKHVIFRETLPKTNVGKVLRRALRDEATSTA